MQPSQPQSSQSPHFIPGRVVVTAPPEVLDKLEQHTDRQGHVGQHLGTALKPAPVHPTAPHIYAYQGQTWQKVTPEIKSDGSTTASETALNTAYQHHKRQRPAQSRRYSFDPTHTSTAEVSQKLSALLNNHNPMGITGFDIVPDHLVTQSYGGGEHSGGSPWKVPARTGVADPTTHAEPENLFKAQSCWQTIGATERSGFAHKGEGVTVAILDTAPDLARIDHGLVDYVITMKAGGGEFDQPLPKMPALNLKKLYTMHRVNPTMPTPPGGADVEAGLMEPYHGMLIASLIRELAPAASIVLVEVLNDRGETTGSNIVEALDYVQFLRDHQATVKGQRIVQDKLVFNLSLGLPRSLSEDVEAVYLLEACQRMAEVGAVMVAAAGNDSYYMHPSNPEEPAAYGYFCDNKTAYDQVIAVSATGPDATEYALYSNQGNLAAPGMDLLMDTGDPANPAQARYIYWAGTSFATPLVTASVALLLGAGVPAKEVKQHLWEGATQPQRWPGVATLHLGRSLQNLSKSTPV